MSQNKTKTAAEDLMASLMKELNLSENDLPENQDTSSQILGLSAHQEKSDSDFSGDLGGDLEADSSSTEPMDPFVEESAELLDLNFNPQPKSPAAAEVPELNKSEESEKVLQQDFHSQETVNSTDKTLALHQPEKMQAYGSPQSESESSYSSTDSEKTVAIAGYAQRSASSDHQVKVSVGQSRQQAYSQGYASWGASSADVQLAQAENLRIAQEKILSLEKDNEKLRLQNEELMAASEIVKERADLLTSQIQEYKNDKDSLEQSYKNEISLVKNQHNRKDVELQKAQQKIDELDSRLKFDMKKIRVRERELENRLELIRAEKNALVKSKDEQILDLRRKLDQLQMEVESYRQKCVELNKVIETNQDSFKRTIRALRLAMANLELQEENKVPLKKVD